MGSSVRRCRAGTAGDDRGTALVEFSMVMVLLFTLVFGIITFGLLMSFRGSMAQSAAEGARQAATAPRPAAAVSPVTPGGYDNTMAGDRAEDATAQAVGGFDQTCNAGAGSLTCTWVVHDCNAAVGVDLPGVEDCMTVELDYDYDSDPLLPEVPLLSTLLPDRLTSRSVVELNR